jgi:hypothetical protein
MIAVAALLYHMTAMMMPVIIRGAVAHADVVEI